MCVCVYVYVITMKCYSQKEWKFAICDNMDRATGYCTKWNMLDRER